MTTADQILSQWLVVVTGGLHANRSFREVFLDGLTAPIRNLKRLNRMTNFRENNQINNPQQDRDTGSENDIIWAL
jgi:hypothetical protein